VSIKLSCRGGHREGILKVHDLKNGGKKKNEKKSGASEGRKGSNSDGIEKDDLGGQAKKCQGGLLKGVGTEGGGSREPIRRSFDW